MLKELALGVGGVNVQPPAGIPSGGLGTKGYPIIHLAINLLLLAAMLLSMGYIIFGGLKWVTSSGDKQKLQNARMTIMYAIIGLIISFLSFLIIQTVGKFFGVTLI